MSFTYWIAVSLQIIQLFAFIICGFFILSNWSNIPYVIKQLWSLGTLFSIGLLYLVVSTSCVSVCLLYTKFVAAITFTLWGVFYWLFSIEYMASAVSIV